MILDTKQYAGLCACGKTHQVITRLAVVEPGCLADFDAYTNELGLSGSRTVIYDENTYHARGLTRPAAAQEIVLPQKDLRADERTVARVLDTLHAGTELLVAVGGGTVHDIARHCAHALEIPFVACPTAASTDGYASAFYGPSLSAMPSLILCDVNVLAGAPSRLSAAGLGVALGKFTALADWRVANLLTGETLCPVAEAMMLQAAVAAQGCGPALKKNDPSTVTQLMYSLLLSGLASQVSLSSRPVLGAAEHFAHMVAAWPDAPAFHFAGELAGMSAVTVTQLYRRMADVDNIAPYLKAFRPTKDDSATSWPFDPALLEAKWEPIRRILWLLPEAAELQTALTLSGAKATLQAMGIPDTKTALLLRLMPCVSGSLTLLPLTRALVSRSATSADVSRTSSRGKRRTEKAIAR